METTSTEGQIERVTVQLRGVPLGEIWLAEGDLVFATLDPARGFESSAEDIRLASEPLWRMGFLQPRRPRIAVEALSPSAALQFELRDRGGRNLPVDFVNVVTSPRPGEHPVVVVYRKHVNAAVASVLREPPRL